MINWTPQPIAFALGPLEVHWYGIMYAIGLAATYLVVEREAVRRGLDTGLLVNGFIIIGGQLICMAPFRQALITGIQSAA